MKNCSHCKELKSYDQFSKCKYTKDGYNYQCRICVKEYQELAKERNSIRRKEHYIENKTKLLADKHKYALHHKKEKQEYDKVYRKKKQLKIKEYKKQWEIKHKDDPIFKLKRNLRRRIHHALVDNTKSKHTIELIGCSIEEFKIYIESLFEPGMSWNNYNFKTWHIDHIIPCYKFDLSIPEHQYKCFHYTNQRPLWAKDNLSRTKT